MAARLPLAQGCLQEHVGLGLGQYGLVEVVPQDVEVSGCSLKRFRPIKLIV